MSIQYKVFSVLSSMEAVVSPPPMLAAVLASVFKEGNDSTGKKSSASFDPNITLRMLRAADLSSIPASKSGNGGNTDYSAAKSMVLSLSIYNQLVDRGFCDDPQFGKMWQRFLEVANAAQYIASNHNPGLVEEAYTAGLLHDLGRVCLHRYFPEEAAIAQVLVSEGMNILAAEKAVYGTDHQEIGHLVAVKWGMPVRLTEVIGNHHPVSEDFVPDLPELTRMIILADNMLFVKQLNLETLRRDTSRLRLLRKSSQSLGVDVRQLNRIYSVLPKHFLYTVNSDADKSEKLDRLSRMNNQLFDLYLELARMFKERQELSRRLLEEGKTQGALDSLHVALATLSHYVNNAMMSIRGQAEVMQMLFAQGDREQAFSRIPAMTESVENAIRKISIVLEELSNITSMDTVSYFKHSKAIDVDNLAFKRHSQPSVLRRPE